MSSALLTCLYLFISVIAITPGAFTQNITPGSRYQAAVCIIRRENCNTTTAELSETCKTNRLPWQQPPECRQRACDFCKYFGPADTVPCNTDQLKYVCANMLPKTNTKDKKMEKKMDEKMDEKMGDKRTKKDMNKCIWTGAGDGSVVVDLGLIKPAKGWTRTKRGKYYGIVYEKEKETGIDPAGKYGKMCFKIRPKFSGSYFFTAISYAEHWTENNDCWTSSSKGFRHYKPNNSKKMFKSHPGQWMKGYQNNGPAGISGALTTKDHDSHTFIIPNVVAGEVFSVCIAGRSYRFEMFRLVLVLCKDKEMCKHGDVMTLPVSSCM